MDLEIVYLSPDELTPYEGNARRHAPDDIEQIKESIAADGFNDPIGIWGEDNVIVEGHGRQIAAKEMGLKLVPCIRLDHLTDTQRRDYAIRHNRTTELSNWDFSKLEEELAQLEIEGVDLSGLKFDVDELSGGDTSESSIVEDEPPEPPETPISKRGDIWQLGNHRLMCGDSTSAEDVHRLMGEEKAGMVFTDPPYGYEYQSNFRSKSEKFDVIENDNKILDFFPLLKGIVSGFVMVCTAWKVLDKWLPLFKLYFDLSNMIIWHKGGGGLGDLERTFATDYEVILCAHNDGKIQQKRIGSVWEIGRDNVNNYEHPTQKPVALSAQAITYTTKRGETVLDLFGGSGSTLIACEQLNRICYMMELDPHYCDVIIQRWENLTGGKAVKLN